MEDMEWFGSIIFCHMPPNSVTFAQNLRQFAKHFANGTVKSGMAGHRYGDSGDKWTLNHHSLNPYGGHGMVWQHHLLSHASKQHHSFAQNLQ
jgi:hypothetical protein